MFFIRHRYGAFIASGVCVHLGRSALSFSYSTSALDEDAENCRIIGAREFVALVHSHSGLARLVSTLSVLPVDLEAIIVCPFRLRPRTLRGEVEVLVKR